MKIKLLIIFMFISAGVSAQIQYLGAPNVTVINRGNFKIDSILYLPKRIKAPTDSGALRYQISDSTLYLWTGSQWIKAKNDGTVTSVSAGTGMSFPTITVNGVINADTAILSTKAWRQKGIDSVASVRVGGTGTTNYIPKWSGTSTQTNSIIQESASGIGINVTPATFTLDVQRTGAAAAVRLKGGSSNNQGSALYMTQAGSASTLLAFGDRGNVFGGKVDSLVSLFTGGGIPLLLDVSGSNRGRISTDGELWINSSADAGDYKLQVSGNIYNTTGAAFATSSGNVLIGTTTDGGSYKLDVQGALRNTTGANFATSSGNVGIGTTSPVSGTGYTGFTVRNNTNGGIIQNTDGTVDLRMQLNPATTGIVGTFSAHPLQIFGAGSEVARAITGNKLLVNKTSDEGDYKLQVNGGIYGNGNAVFAATSGNVGIGTTSPLVASGHTVLTVRNATGGIIQVTDGTVDARTLITAADRVNIGTWSSHPVDFATNATTKMRITPTGDVGIGTVSPTERLDVNGRTRIRTIDSTSTAMNMLYADATGVIKKAAVPTQIQTAEAVITGDYTVSLTDYFVSLPDLTTASRNVVLPNTAVNGRQLIIFNTSSDATYKWTFTNEDVEDASGAAITTLTDQKSYTMVYYNGKFRVTAIN